MIGFFVFECLTAMQGSAGRCLTGFSFWSCICNSISTQQKIQKLFRYFKVLLFFFFGTFLILKKKKKFGKTKMKLSKENKRNKTFKFVTSKKQKIRRGAAHELSSIGAAPRGVKKPLVSHRYDKKCRLGSKIFFANELSKDHPKVSVRQTGATTLCLRTTAKVSVRSWDATQNVYTPIAHWCFLLEKNAYQNYVV